LIFEIISPIKNNIAIENKIKCLSGSSVTKETGIKIIGRRPTTVSRTQSETSFILEIIIARSIKY
jgi:hypothetical protein